ncbi:ATP/GTP-binding site motif A [Methanosarcina siciliae T4/M]|uniref:ATP/GTP-binding site motif A n=1 Tax=Methanosarcina siciliae T4/M TaxID=1434120 RepID=A0A0E3P5J8_9EURY|nr:hypothetical protein [Methanosarcina siciliae]AKB27934.1 ATP/GTP-binding site motif A [Methanosarcina siciliae T4/M]
MPEKFERKQIELSFKKFNGYADDVLSSDYYVFDTTFNRFIQYCENDPVMSYICNQLKSVDIEYDEWCKKLKHTSERSVFDLPSDETKSYAILYQICLKVNKKDPHYFDFSRKFLGAPDKTVAISRFNKTIVKPLAREINYRLDKIMYDIEIDHSGERYLQPTVLNLNLDASTNVNNCDIKMKNDSIIGNNAKIIKTIKENKTLRLFGVVVGLVTGIASIIEIYNYCTGT